MITLASGIEVSLEGYSSGKWRKLREFNTEQTLKRESSINTTIKVVCASTGPFRIRISADTKAFPPPPSNALRVCLNLDCGDQLNNYETFVAYGKGESIKELQEQSKVPVMRQDGDKWTYCLDRVIVPFKGANDRDWRYATFEFTSLRDGQPKANGPVSMHQGRIRIDITHVEIVPTRPRDIILDPQTAAKYVSKDLLMNKGITLEARLKYQIERVKPFHHFKRVGNAKSQQYNYIFLHREEGTVSCMSREVEMRLTDLGRLKEVCAEDVDIVMDKSVLNSVVAKSASATSAIPSGRPLNQSVSHGARKGKCTDNTTPQTESIHVSMPSDQISALPKNSSSSSLKHTATSQADNSLASVHSDLSLIPRDSLYEEKIHHRARERLEEINEKCDRTQEKMLKCQKYLDQLKIYLQQLCEEKGQIQACMAEVEEDQANASKAVKRILKDANQNIVTIQTKSKTQLERLSHMTRKRKRTDSSVG